MDRIKEFLAERKSENLYRTLKPIEYKKGGKVYFNGREYFDFSSNDYLGLSEHAKLKAASKEAIEKFGLSASASRLLSGDFLLHHELEEKIAEFKGKDSALVFNSGYQANVGIISAMCRHDSVIFSDKLNHASIIDGILLSKARFFRYNHNDASHLESLLKKERSKSRDAIIITETIFSMDGDRCPLKDIVGLKEKYDCALMVDEAHATGVFGINGSGVVEEDSLTSKVDLIMGTFSKALGGFGAYLAASEEIKNFLINSSRSFIYSTALPFSVIAANLASLSLVKEEPFRRKRLLSNSNYFRQELQKRGFDVRGSSQIVPLILGDSKDAIHFCKNLQKKGYWVFPIRPPTVPDKESRLRFSLMYYHTKEILEKLADDVYEISRK